MKLLRASIAALALTVIAAVGACRVPDRIRPAIAQHSGEHGSATSIGLSGEWDWGDTSDDTLDQILVVLKESRRAEAEAVMSLDTLRTENEALREQLRARDEEGPLDQSDMTIGGGMGAVVLILLELLRREKKKD